MKPSLAELIAAAKVKVAGMSHSEIETMLAAQRASLARAYAKMKPANYTIVNGVKVYNDRDLGGCVVEISDE